MHRWFDSLQTRTGRRRQWSREANRPHALWETAPRAHPIGRQPNRRIQWVDGSTVASARNRLIDNLGRPETKESCRPVIPLLEYFASYSLDSPSVVYPPDRKSTRLNSSHHSISYA